MGGRRGSEVWRATDGEDSIAMEWWWAGHGIDREARTGTSGSRSASLPAFESSSSKGEYRERAFGRSFAVIARQADPAELCQSSRSITGQLNKITP